MKILKKRSISLLIATFTLASFGLLNTSYANHGDRDVNEDYPLSNYKCNDQTTYQERKDIVKDAGGINAFAQKKMGQNKITWVYDDNKWIQKTLYVNEEFLYTNCLFVFGDHDDVSYNPGPKKGQYVFLGYDIHGKPYPNPAHPEFFARTDILTTDDYKWWKNPWNRPWAAQGESRPEFDDFVGRTKLYTDTERKKALATALDKYHNSAQNGTFVDGGWITSDKGDASVLNQYADIRYIGDDWTAGTFTLYMDVTGHYSDVYGWTTFFIPPLKDPFAANARVTQWMPEDIYHMEDTYVRTDLYNEDFNKALKAPCTVGNASYIDCKSPLGSWTNKWFVRVKKGFNQNSSLDSNVVFDRIIDDGYVAPKEDGSVTAREYFNLPAGDYTIWAKVPDYKNEGDYDDNWTSMNFTVKPVDLELQNYFKITPDDAQKSDTNITGMDIKVKNNTDKELKNFEIQYYWESDPSQKYCEQIPSIDAKKTLAVTLGASENEPCDGQITQPAIDYPRYDDLSSQTDVGLVVNVNYNKKIAETDYTNNQRTFNVKTNGLDALIYSTKFSYYAINENESEVTIQTKIANKMNNQIDSTCLAPATVSNWTVKEYNKRMTTDRTPPKFADISGLTPVATYTTSDFRTFIPPSNVDYKVYHFKTTVNMPKAETVQLPVTYIDDTFSIYVNGSLIKSGIYLNTYDIDLPLNQGNNTVEILYYEHTANGKIQFGESLKDIAQSHETCKYPDQKQKLTFKVYDTKWTSNTGDDVLVKTWTKTYEDIGTNKITMPITSKVALPPGNYRLETSMPYYKNEYNYTNNEKKDNFEVSISEDNEYVECKNTTPTYITKDLARFCIGTYPYYPSTKIEEGQGTYFYVKYRFFPMPLPTYEVDNNLGVNKFIFEGNDDWNQWTNSSSFWTNESIYNDNVMSSVYKATTVQDNTYYYDYSKDANGENYYSFTAGDKYQYSIWLKSDVAINNVSLKAFTKDQAGTTVNTSSTKTINVGKTWKRYDITLTSTRSGKFGIGYSLGNVGTGKVMYAALPSLNEVLEGNTQNDGLRQQFTSIEPLDELGNVNTFLYKGNDNFRGRMFADDLKFDFSITDPQGTTIPETIGTVYYAVPNTCISTYSLDFKDTRDCREVSFYMPNDEVTLNNKSKIPDESKRLNFTNPGTHTFDLKVTESQNYYYQHNTGNNTNPNWGPVEAAGSFTQRDADWRYNFSNPTTNFTPPASSFGQTSWTTTNNLYRYQYKFNVSGISSANGKK